MQNERSYYLHRAVTFLTRWINSSQVNQQISAYMEARIQTELRRLDREHHRQRWAELIADVDDNRTRTTCVH